MKLLVVLVKELIACILNKENIYLEIKWILTLKNQ